MKIFKKLMYKQYINTKNKRHLHRPNTTISCFQKCILYAGSKIFNSLSDSLTVLKNEKTKFKAILRQYSKAHSACSVDDAFICKDGL